MTSPTDPTTTTPTPGPSTGPATGGAPTTIDPRGPRVSAGITAVLLLVVILLQGLATDLDPVAVVIEAFVVASFALGAFGGLHRTWQGAIYRSLVAPRLAPPTEREDVRPPTFAQLVGFIITGVGLVLALLGVPYALVVSAALAFVAAFLNSVFAFCLGCEIYAIGVRLRAGRSAA